MMFADHIVLGSEDLKKLEERFKKRRRSLKDHGIKISQTKAEYICIGMNDEKLKVSGVEIKKSECF